MMQFPVDPTEVVEILKNEFPREFTIIMQGLHIKKLQEYIEMHELTQEVDDITRVDNG